MPIITPATKVRVFATVTYSDEMTLEDLAVTTGEDVRDIIVAFAAGAASRQEWIEKNALAEMAKTDREDNPVESWKVQVL